MMTSQVALKEWAIVLEALGVGRQMILLRKGGIRDPQGAFQLKHREFFLYPTWEHQGDEVDAIRPEFQPRLKELLAQPRNPNEVALTLYAGVAFCAQVQDPKKLAGLEPFHIYTEDFFRKRMSYRPLTPTLLVALRAYRLNPPVTHQVTAEEAGCKSWVPLLSPLKVNNASPVIDNQRFRQALEELSDRCR